MKPNTEEKQKDAGSARIASSDLLSTGFEPCEQGVNDEDYCECCDKKTTFSELYYRRTFVDVDEGQYYCLECVIKEKEANDKAIEEAEADYEKWVKAGKPVTDDNPY